MHGSTILPCEGFARRRLLEGVWKAAFCGGIIFRRQQLQQSDSGLIDSGLFTLCELGVQNHIRSGDVNPSLICSSAARFHFENGGGIWKEAASFSAGSSYSNLITEGLDWNKGLCVQFFHVTAWQPWLARIYKQRMSRRRRLEGGGVIFRRQQLQQSDSRRIGLEPRTGLGTYRQCMHGAFH